MWKRIFLGGWKIWEGSEEAQKHPTTLLEEVAGVGGDVGHSKRESYAEEGHQEKRGMSQGIIYHTSTHPVHGTCPDQDQTCARGYLVWEEEWVAQDFFVHLVGDFCV